MSSAVDRIAPFAIKIPVWFPFSPARVASSEIILTSQDKKELIKRKHKHTRQPHSLSIGGLAGFQQFYRITAGHQGPQYYLNSQAVNSCQVANKLSS